MEYLNTSNHFLGGTSRRNESSSCVKCPNSLPVSNERVIQVWVKPLCTRQSPRPAASSSESSGAAPGRQSSCFSPGCKTARVSAGHLLAACASSPSCASTACDSQKLAGSQSPEPLCSLCWPHSVPALRRVWVLTGSSGAMESRRDPASAHAAAAQRAEIQTSTS